MVSSPLGLNWEVVPGELSFSCWLAELIVHGPHDAAEIACMLSYYIWKAQNMLCFEEKRAQSMIMMYIAVKKLEHYKEQRRFSSGDAAATCPRARWMQHAKGVT